MTPFADERRRNGGLSSASCDLDNCQQVELQKAHPYGLQRFERYRRAGHDVDEAFMFAMAWARNVSEQAVRRVSHGTGAT